MSDLLIKGVEMPKCCCDCKIFSGEGYLCPLLEDSAHWLETVRNKRVADCPLVEIPTHGRLIDADSLIEYINEELKSSEYIQRMFRRIVKSRPTVIEAETEG